MKYVAVLAYPAKQELTKEEEDVSDRDESSRVLNIHCSKPSIAR
jgi:hypothetical protein